MSRGLWFAVGARTRRSLVLLWTALFICSLALQYVQLATPTPVLATKNYECGARLSPDGRWLAYVSNDSGQNEVYVRPYPGPDRRVPVSTAGGTQRKVTRPGRILPSEGSDLHVLERIRGRSRAA